MMSIFNLINDDLDRIKSDINTLIDQSTKQELSEEEKALEIKFNAGLIIRESSEPSNNTLEISEADAAPHVVSFNKKDMRIILEHTKKENESVMKEIEAQEKNLKLVKENVNKILNK